jgi:hypothetical protein
MAKTKSEMKEARRRSKSHERPSEKDRKGRKCPAQAASASQQAVSKTSEKSLNISPKIHAANRPHYAISTRGSSYGAEATLEERWSQKNIDFVRDLWNLTDEDVRQLLIVKDKIADLDHWKNNPFEVVRFVTGPQGYGKAAELFRTMVEWRIENNVDNLLDEYTPPKILLDYLPSAILQGYDKEGDAVYLERGGMMDGHGLLSRFAQERLLKHIVWSRELASRGRWIEEYEKVQGRPPTRLTIIYDLQGLNSQHLRPGVLPFLNESMRITQQRYNGLAKRMIIIRSPPVFNVVWGLCKYVFPKNAVKKMIFAGPKNYKEVLEQHVDLNILPPCIVPGAKGHVAIDMPPRLEGGLIPEYLPNDDDWAEEKGHDSGDTTSRESDSDAESVACSGVRCKLITSGCWKLSGTSKSIKVFG